MSWVAMGGSRVTGSPPTLPVPTVSPNVALDGSRAVAPAVLTGIPLERQLLRIAVRGIVFFEHDDSTGAFSARPSATGTRSCDPADGDLNLCFDPISRCPSASPCRCVSRKRPPRRKAHPRCASRSRRGTGRSQRRRLDEHPPGLRIVSSRGGRSRRWLPGPQSGAAVVDGVRRSRLHDRTERRGVDLGTAARALRLPGSGAGREEAERCPRRRDPSDVRLGPRPGRVVRQRRPRARTRIYRERAPASGRGAADLSALRARWAATRGERGRPRRPLRGWPTLRRSLTYSGADGVRRRRSSGAPRTLRARRGRASPGSPSRSGAPATR